MKHELHCIGQCYSVCILHCITERNKSVNFVSRTSQNLLIFNVHEINRTSIFRDFIFALSNSLNGVYIRRAYTISRRWVMCMCMCTVLTLLIKKKNKWHAETQTSKTVKITEWNFTFQLTEWWLNSIWMVADWRRERVFSVAFQSPFSRLNGRDISVTFQSI